MMTRFRIAPQMVRFPPNTSLAKTSIVQSLYKLVIDRDFGLSEGQAMVLNLGGGALNPYIYNPTS